MRQIALATIVAAAVIAAGCGLFKSPTSPDEQATISSFTVDALTVAVGGPTTLHWTVTGKEPIHCTITPALGDVPLSGSATVAPTATTTYTLTVTQGGYQIARSLTVVVK